MTDANQLQQPAETPSKQRGEDGLAAGSINGVRLQLCRNGRNGPVFTFVLKASLLPFHPAPPACEPDCAGTPAELKSLFTRKRCSISKSISGRSWGLLWASASLAG